jgi:hypothetical protein
MVPGAELLISLPPMASSVAPETRYECGVHSYIHADRPGATVKLAVDLIKGTLDVQLYVCAYVILLQRADRPVRTISLGSPRSTTQQQLTFAIFVSQDQLSVGAS